MIHWLAHLKKVDGSYSFGIIKNKIKIPKFKFKSECSKNILKTEKRLLTITSQEGYIAPFYTFYPKGNYWGPRMDAWMNVMHGWTWYRDENVIHGWTWTRIIEYHRMINTYAIYGRLYVCREHEGCYALHDLKDFGEHRHESKLALQGRHLSLFAPPSIRSL